MKNMQNNVPKMEFLVFEIEIWFVLIKIVQNNRFNRLVLKNGSEKVKLWKKFTPVGATSVLGGYQHNKFSKSFNETWLNCSFPKGNRAWSWTKEIDEIWDI